MKTNLLNAFLFSGLAFFYSCSSGNNAEETNTDTSKIISQEEKKTHAEIVMYNIPSPVETSQLLLDAGAKYDGGLTNKAENYKQYKSSEAQAVNLGVHGSDLSFAGVFQNAQECMSFMKSINSLCGELGISGAFNENTAERIDKNKNNKDSVLDIISKSFWEADGYLKENNRSNISSLLITGGWIEGMYIASKVYDKTKSEKIKNRIICAPQANALKSLIAMLEGEKFNTDAATSVISGLKNLNSVFEKIPSAKTETKAVTDKEKHETKLETKSDIKVSDEVLNDILKNVVSLRNSIIALK